MKKANFEKTWLSKLGHHGNVNVDVVVTTSLKCSQMNSISQSGEEPYLVYGYTVNKPRLL